MNSAPYTSDTSRDAMAVQLDGLRKMTPRERIRRMCSLSHRVRRMAFDAIRRRHPEFHEAEVQILFIELTYGKSLADGIRRWKAEKAS
jgi:hypothetical protein